MPETKPAPQGDAPPTVLVVEDEVLIRLAIAEYLRACGWRVIEAGSAAEAIAVLEASDVAIDGNRRPGPTLRRALLLMPCRAVWGSGGGVGRRGGGYG